MNNKTYNIGDCVVSARYDECTNDYIITVPPEAHDLLRELYNNGYADLTFGEFVRKLLGIYTTHDP